MNTEVETVKLTKREKALLEILIAEILELNPNESIKKLLENWITANDLHPERVQTLEVSRKGDERK